MFSYLSKVVYVTLKKRVELEAPNPLEIERVGRIEFVNQTLH